MSIRALLLCPALLLAACGGDNTSSPAPAAEDTGTTDEVAVEDTGDPEAAAPVAPNTPTMNRLSIMGVNFHVFWTLNDTALNKVYLYRKKDAGEYELAYTLGSRATNIHDGEAVGPARYCYKVQTERAGVKSEFSNEKCGTLP